MANFNLSDMIEARGEKVRMRAVAFGTTPGPFGILHTDPNGLDKRARDLYVYPAEADVLELAGLAKRLRTVTIDDDLDGSEGFDSQGSQVGLRATEQLERMAVIDGLTPNVTGLDSRTTTHHGDNRVDIGTVDETSPDNGLPEEDGAPTSGATKRRPGRPAKVSPEE